MRHLRAALFFMVCANGHYQILAMDEHNEASTREDADKNYVEESDVFSAILFALFICYNS